MQKLLAVDHLQMTLRRNAVATAAMMVSLGIIIGVSTMIASFRDTVVNWIEYVTPADLYISSPAPLTGTTRTYLDPALVTYLTSLTEIRTFDTVSSRIMWKSDRKIRVVGTRFSVIESEKRMLFKERNASISPQKNCFVSEPYAQRFNVSLNDSINISLDNGDTHTLTVAGIHYDYSSDQGVVTIDHALFEKLYGESRKQGVSLYLDKPREELPKIRNELIKEFPNSKAVLRDNATLRKEVLVIFDRTFAITYALQTIALFVAALTVVNNVLMLVLERAREFAIIRALGAHKRVLLQSISIESLLLGITALLLAFGVGLGLSLQLVYVINKHFFGWSIVFVFPWKILLATTFATLGLCLATGLIPTLFRGSITQHIRYE